MLEAAALLGFASVAAAVAYGWRVVYLRGLVLDRLGEPAASSEQQVRRDAATRAAATSVGRSPLSRPLRWLPWALTLPAGLVLYFVVGMPWPYCVSLAVIAGLLGSQLEAFLAIRKAAKLEAQLADAVDIMVGALGAGAGVAGALEAAIQETNAPLQGQLEEILGRIRFGDQPQSVFKNLAERIPLETFLLFASTLAVHWEVGGSLAPTLATVGRTVRDRIDISRRIRSNTAQSQISTIMVLGLTYFIALVVYSNGPEQMQEFLSTSIGSFFAAGSMLLQAVGMLWMSHISRMRF
jgi:Flp pilus assembly protein TadB